MDVHKFSLSSFLDLGFALDFGLNLRSSKVLATDFILNLSANRKRLRLRG